MTTVNKRLTLIAALIFTCGALIAMSPDQANHLLLNRWDIWTKNLDYELIVNGKQVDGARKKTYYFSHVRLTQRCLLTHTFGLKTWDGVDPAQSVKQWPTNYEVVRQLPLEQLKLREDGMARCDGDRRCISQQQRCLNDKCAITLKPKVAKALIEDQRPDMAIPIEQVEQMSRYLEACRLLPDKTPAKSKDSEAR